MIVLLSCVVVFHLLVLLGVVPYDVVWGGRLEGARQMRTLELVSFAVNLVAISVVAMKVNFIKPVLPARHVTLLLWVLTFIFALNTVGNLFAITSTETFVFTPMTLIVAVLLYRLSID